MLLQSETPTLDDRISKSRAVRNEGGISLGGCQPNRVQANSSDPNEENFNKGEAQFTDSIFNIYTDTLMPILRTLAQSGSLMTFKNFVYVGSIIRNGELFSIRHLEEPTINLLQKADPAVLSDISNQFRDRAYAIPLAMQYCSITDRTCDVVSTRDTTCKIDQ
jgi:hypothetical protein